MACPIIYIKNFIEEYKTTLTNNEIDVSDLKKKLFDNYSIMTKYSEEDNLLLLYHKYNLPTNSDLEQDCRSLVIDLSTLEVISYTCPNTISNKEAQQFMLNNNDLDYEMYKCYEGSILSLFNHNNKWYLSTRRCLDSKKSKSLLNDSNYYDMFIDVLNKENLTFDEFTDKLDKNYGYYFIIIHHFNKNIIDYVKQFGQNYAKLCLIFVRRKEDQTEITDYEFGEYENIFKPEKMSMEEFAELNHNLNIDVDLEGIIVKTIKENKAYLFKLQTTSYQFCKAIGTDINIYKGYLYLYQNGSLKEYIENNKDHKNLEKIINPHNTSESFDIIGVVDSVFKVITSEFFELYKLLWKLTNGEKQNEELYKILPKEYKDFLYNLRGIYFKIKATSINTLNEKKLFTIKDIYQYLKSIDTEKFCALLRQRKLMLNYVTLNKINNTNSLNQFRTISNQVDKIHIKLTAIFTNKLFPDITSTNIPEVINLI
jgi:hypothetical protein